MGVAHSFGFIGISVIAMYLPDRQLLTIACSALYALNLTYLIFIPESPIWLLSTDQFDKAQTSIASLVVATSIQPEYKVSTLSILSFFKI